MPNPSLNRPTQAVILAGGRGTRLLPLTATRPKPMIEFHGRPFLEYLLEQLRDQGVNRILLLLGYLPDVIKDYFGNGERFGVSIEYGVTDVNDETGTRLRAARHLIDPVFLLLYCDNYLPFSFDAMWKRWGEIEGDALVTVYANEDNYTRSNLRVDSDGRVAVYDKSRSAENLQGVDIGYMLVRRDVIDLIPAGNPSFEATVYPQLIGQRRFFGFLTRHRYYSVGDHKRLPLTEEFLCSRRTLLLDRDGVLNRKRPKGEYVRSWRDWEWLDGALEALRMLRQSGFRVVLLTDQPGIADGVMTERDLADIHRRMRDDVERAGGHIDAIFHCPHGQDAGCWCRKPAPGMLYQAQRTLHLDLTKALYVGDDECDQRSAAAAACPFRMVGNGASLRSIVAELIAHQPETRLSGV